MYAQRLQNAQSIADNYRKKMEIGDANILEVNKAELNLASVQSEHDKIVAERTSLLTTLAQMNGGKTINVTENNFSHNTLPASFEEWYKQVESKNPALQHAEGLLLADKQRLKVTQNQWLPQINIGYVNETVAEESFQGIALGLSLPLWNNHNKVKQSKVKVEETELQLSNTRNSFYNDMKNLYLLSATLIQNADKLNSTLSKHNSEKLLQKALDAGEISLLEYLLEIDFFQDAAINALAAQRDAKIALAELYIMEL
jgi:outer membrane protein TolC